jgi:spermidine/putrescine-binding protein
MKKVIASVMVAVLIPCLLTGCIKKVDTAKETTKETTEQTAAAQSEKTEQTEGQAAESAAAQTEVQAAGTEAEMTAQTEAEPAAQTEAEAAEAGKSAKGSGKVVVYNWGEYIDPDVLDQFEEETGIEVVYEEFETNEIMYPKVAAGAASYDLICPSDYMIAKMIANDMLQPINFDHIPNYKNIDETYIEQSKGFDPENKYSIPYCWGTVGILYNTSMIEEGDTVDSWEILWDEKYKDNILMQDSVRDAFMVAEKLLGYDINTVDEEELKACADKLIEQKPLVQAYVIDQVRDKMIGGEAALGVIYSGEAIYTARENEDLEYVIPKEGSNVWIDSWVIPKDAQNVENAEKFLDFLCRGDIAMKNFDYITYSTPNKEARELIEDEDIKNSTVAFPTAEMLENSQVYTYIGEDGDALYAKYWDKVKSN